jgi:hypothetical protein
MFEANFSTFELILVYFSVIPVQKTKHEVQKLGSTYTEGCDAESNKTINQNIKVPSFLPNTNTRHCKTIEISYDLTVEAEVSGFHENILFKFPIVIGNVSLDANQMIQTPFNSNLAMPSGPLPYGFIQYGFMPTGPMTYGYMPSGPMPKT